MTKTKSGPALLGPRRRLFQWGLTLVVLLLPWLKFQGISVLRVDIPTLSLHFLGQVMRIEELYLLLLVVLLVVFAFLLITLVFGRVWCGWACPQTTLNDVAEWLQRRLGLPLAGKGQRRGNSVRRFALHGAYLLLALLVSSNLLWYFIEPRRYFQALLALELHPAATTLLAIVTTAVYLDLALVRRLMCSEFCPYGRLQSTLADDSTLTLQRPDSEAPRCIDCGACVRACPMGIDIRDGEQIECINCGRCLDACRVVMARRGQPGLISYRFGVSGRGQRPLLNPRILLLSVALASIFLVLVFAVTQRRPATLKVARSHTVASRVLTDGRQATFFNLWVNNRARKTAEYDITVRSSVAGPLQLRGPATAIRLDPGENRRIDLVVVSVPPVRPRPIEFLLLTDGTEVATAAATLSNAK